jgi:serine protease inhibitor
MRTGSSRTEGREENLFFSPYSIYTVLALLYGGAAGETAEQMADALHIHLEPAATIHGRWAEARDIRSGDVLLVREGVNATVSGTSSRNVTAEVYFLEIEGFHNHVVGRQGILVHNGAEAKKSAGPPEFMADHPFLFFVQDEPTGTVLFMGRLLDPGLESTQE